MITNLQDLYNWMLQTDNPRIFMIANEPTGYMVYNADYNHHDASRISNILYTEIKNKYNELFHINEITNDIIKNRYIKLNKI